MKLIEQERKIKLSEGLEEIPFGIIFNRKMADILSNKLYSDKVLAVVREYSTNAREGHVFNGNEDKPFDVCLPTWSDSTFYIRDYGIGMSPQKIEENVTQYGWSDKDNTNDVDGALGLGFKVGFAYHTRTFTVDSWFGGRHYIYQCYLNQESMPCMTEMANELSNEPTGIKITIKVDSGDYLLFEKAAEKVYTYFPVKPNFIGHKIEIEKPSYVLNGDGWSLRPNGDCPRAIMGVLAYPIECDSLNNGRSYNDILECPFDIDFDLGDLDIEPSREGLGYDNRTKVHIRNKFDKVIEECSNAIQEKIKNAKNLWDARCSYFTLRDNVPSSAIKMINWSKIEYNGVRLFPSDAGNVMLSDFDDVTVTKFGKGRYSWRNHSHKITKSQTRKIPADPNAIFYINDNGKSWINRVKDKRVETDKDIFVFKFDNEESKREVFEHLGLDESYFEKISSLPASNNNNHGGGGVAKKTRVMEFDKENYTDKKNYYWKDTSIDLKNPQDVMYVETCRYDIRYKGKTIEPYYLSKLIEVLKENKINSPKIIGVKTADLKKAKNIPNFLNWVLDKVSHDDYNYSSKQLKHDKYELENLFDYYSGIEEGSLRNLSKKLSETHSISEFVQLIDKTRLNIKNLSPKERLKSKVQRLDLKIGTEETLIKRGLKEKKEEILKTYPMLNVIRNGCEVEPVVDYINLIDKGENDG